MPIWALWLVLAAVFVALEMLSMDLTFAMLALGAAAAGIAGLLGAPLWLQIVIGAVVAGASLGLIRPKVRARLMPKETPSFVERMAGSKAVVLQEVTDHSGQVRLHGEVWTARAYDDAQCIAPGETVTVMEIRGATAMVWRDTV